MTKVEPPTSIVQTEHLLPSELSFGALPSRTVSVQN